MFGSPRETCQHSERYRRWQPHFRENICLEVPSFLIFNVSPGAPRQHMFPACPQDMAAGVHSTVASCTDASSHSYCLPHRFCSLLLLLFFFSLLPPLIPAAETDGPKLQRQLCLKSTTTNSQQRPYPTPFVTKMTKSLIGIA